MAYTRATMPGQLQLRAAAVPGWSKGLLIGGAFFIPLVWVVGDDNLFDWTLARLSEQFGETADFRHLLAYLLCVVVLLIPAGVVLQLFGAWRLRRQSGS